MKKLKKLLRDTFPNIIDWFYGITEIWLDYYKIFVGVTGIFYLAAIFPSEILRKIWGDIPKEFLRSEYQTGAFSQAVNFLFLITVIFKVSILLSDDVSIRAKANSICEVITGSVLVYIQIYLDPVITSDKLINFIFYFMLIKWGLKIITRMFKIPTRHFGIFMDREIYQAYCSTAAIIKSEGGK
ncbi:MAG: hypothetical protein E7247_09750 [Paenibacillaceae bacterium]|nr:hypothetical protein [Paenibacillaceae bacterium]